MADSEEWRQVERYRGEQESLEAEARRLVALTREAQMRREILERKLQDRIDGHVSMPASEWLERADAERDARVNGRTYPQEWSERAAEADRLSSWQARSRRGRYDKPE